MTSAPRPITIGMNLTSAVPVAVYTVPTGYDAKWNLMYLMNGTGSTKHCTVYWSDASTATDIYVLNQTSVAAKEFVKLDGGAYTVMDEGDTVKMRSEAGSSFSTICTFELIKKEGI